MHGLLMERVDVFGPSCCEAITAQTDVACHVGGCSAPSVFMMPFTVAPLLPAFSLSSASLYPEPYT